MVITKIEIANNIFIEIPMKCVKEVAENNEYNDAIVWKWLGNENNGLLKQFQFIKDKDLATYVAEMGMEQTINELTETISRKELIQWVFFNACIIIQEEL